MIGRPPAVSWTPTRAHVRTRPHTPAPHPAWKGALVSASVLVIEDDLATARLIRTVLEAEGYAIRLAVGAAGLALALSAPPTLILLDVHMPDMDGPEVSRRLRADPTTAAIPIVGMSAVAATATAATGMDADAWLAKPFTLEALLSTLAPWAPL